MAGSDYLQRAQPFLDFVAKHLFKRDVAALSETEKPIQGDSWYWADDNAKALEAFIVPAAYAKYREVADGLTNFIKTMWNDSAIYRRLAAPTLVIDRADASSFKVHNGLLEVTGNLRADEINVSYRFHDGRSTNALRFGGNWLRFNANGREYQFFVRDHISEAVIKQSENSVALSYTAALRLNHSDKHPVALITYRYFIHAASTYVDQQVNIEALDPAAPLSRVRFTSSMDQLSSLVRQFHIRVFVGSRLGFRNARTPQQTVDKV